MPDNTGGPTLPNSNSLSVWSFGEMVAALTGTLIDLKKAMNASWITFNPKADSKGSFYSYTFRGDDGGILFSADLPNGASDPLPSWNKALATMDQTIADFPTGVIGELNSTTLVQVARAVYGYDKWLANMMSDLNAWNSALSSDDSAFKGKAAYLIQQAILQKRDAFDDLRQQMRMYGKGSFDELFAAHTTLESFLLNMQQLWYTYRYNYPRVEYYLWQEQQSIDLFLVNNHIVSDANGDGKTDDLYWGNFTKYRKPTTASWTMPDGVTITFRTGSEFKPAEARKFLAHYSNNLNGITVSGDLCTTDCWQQINNRVAQRVSNDIKALSIKAQEYFGQLTTQYLETTNTLLPLVAPPKPSSILYTPKPLNNSNNDLGLNNLANLNNLNGGLNDLLSHLNNSGGGLSNLGGLGNSLNNLNSGLGNNLSGYGGGLNNLGGSGYGLNNIGYGGGVGYGLNNVGSGADFGLGSHNSGGLTGASGAAGLAGLAGLAGAGGLAGLSAAGGTAGAAGKAGSAASAAAKEAAAAKSLAGAEELAASKGLGGVPFYPPSMGGMGGGMGGDQPKERERLTWLTEDEDVWGTSVSIGPGVVGRHDIDPDEADEIAVLPGALPAYSRRSRRKSGTGTADRRKRTARGTAEEPTASRADAPASGIGAWGPASAPEPVAGVEQAADTERADTARSADEAAAGDAVTR